jgi:hypothetical protein
MGLFFLFYLDARGIEEDSGVWIFSPAKALETFAHSQMATGKRNIAIYRSVKTTGSLLREGEPTRDLIDSRF